MVLWSLTQIFPPQSFLDASVHLTLGLPPHLHLLSHVLASVCQQPVVAETQAYSWGRCAGLGLAPSLGCSSGQSSQANCPAPTPPQIWVLYLGFISPHSSATFPHLWPSECFVYAQLGQ